MFGGRRRRFDRFGSFFISLSLIGLMAVPITFAPLSTSGFSSGITASSSIAQTGQGCRRQSTSESSARAFAAGESSISVTVSPASAPAGSVVTISGQVPPGTQVPQVHVLFRDCNITRGLTTASVDSKGNFSVPVMIPPDATVGPHEIIVTGGSTSDPNKPGLSVGSANFNTLPLPPGNISGVVLLEQAGGKLIPAEYEIVVLVTKEKGVVQGDTADANGKFHFANVPPGEYTFGTQKHGYIFDIPVVNLQSFQNLTVNIVGKPSSAGVGGCLAWKQVNESKGKRLGMFAEVSQAKQSNFVLTGTFDIGTFVSLPGKAVPVSNQFTAALPFNLFSLPQGMTVQLWFRRAGEVVKQVNAQLGVVILFPIASAAVDMSEFQPGSYEVQTVIKGPGGALDQCLFEPSLTFTMIEHPPWFEGCVANRDLKFKGNRYEFSGLLPKQAIYWSEPIKLELFTLQNIVSLGIPIAETFYLDGSWQGSAAAEAQVTFLSINVLKESVAYNAAGDFANHTYTLPTIHKDLFAECQTLFHPFFGIPEILDVYADVKLCYGGFVDVNSTIPSDLRPNLTISPGGGLSIPVEAGVHILVCKGSVTATPSTTLHLPISLGFCPDLSGGFDQPCLSVDLQICAAVQCGICCGKKFCPCATIFSKCFPKHLLSWGCGGSSELAGADEDVTQPETALDFFPGPSVASDGTGHALAVWIQEQPAGPTEPDFRLYYSYYDGATWGPPRPISDEKPLIDMPKVVFLGPNRALAVWMQNKLSFQEVEASDVARVFSSVELYYAIWDGRRWSAPAPVTNDDAFDARPSLAADPSTGQAMLAWLRVNQPTGPTGPPDDLYYASFDGRQWSMPARIDPRSTGFDLQATIKFDNRGQSVAAWLRDLDGNIGTSEDWQMLMSRFDGRAWSAPEAIPNLPAGAFTPSFAFDKDNNPILVFAVPPRDPVTGRLASGVGGSSALYSAYRRGNRWEVVSVGQNTYAEAPIVNVNPDNRAIIMYRQFGDKGDVHASGDLAAAVADLNAPELQWTNGFLTADGKVNWEVAFDIDRSTSNNFVLNVKKTPGRAGTASAEVAEALAQLPKGEQVGGNVVFNTLGGSKISFDALIQGAPDISVASFVVPYAVDLATTTEEIAISNTHPVVGDTITLTATVHNAGLKATSKSTPFTVKFYDGDPASGRATLISEQRVEEPMRFNTGAQVSVPFTIQQGGGRTITVVVDEENAIAESDERNNRAQVTLGQPPAPSQLLAQPESEPRVISLRWTAPDTPGIDYYLIFRSTTPGGPYEVVGDTTETEFIDTLVRPGVTYYYVIVTVDMYGARSTFSNETKTQLQ